MEKNKAGKVAAAIGGGLLAVGGIALAIKSIFGNKNDTAEGECECPEEANDEE